MNVLGDRAIAVRALAFASVAAGFSVISNCPRSRSVNAVIAALTALGARVGAFGLESTTVMVTGGELSAPAAPLLSDLLPADAALIAALAAARGINLAAELPEALAHAVAFAHTGGRYELPQPPDGSVKAALLAGHAGGAEALRIEGDHDTPDHTERMLERLSADVHWDGMRVDLAPSRLVGTEIEIPGDLSAAAYLVVSALATPGAGVSLPSVSVNPTRTAILDCLIAMGGQITRTDEFELGSEPQATLQTHSSELHGITIDAPTIVRLGDDLVACAAAAAVARGRTTFESGDPATFARIAALLRLFGANVERVSNGYAIEGTPGGLRAPAGPVPTFGDHRIAAAAAALAGAAGPVTLDDSASLDATYPGLTAVWKTALTSLANSNASRNASIN